MNGRIFISYSRTDFDFSGRLADALKASGLTVWIDQTDIPVSVPWFEEIQQGIADANLVIAVDSHAWRSSKNCVDEMELADAMGKTLLRIPPDSDILAAVSIIEEHLERQTSLARVEADLLGDSFRWNRSGRPSELLPTGTTLKSYRRAIRAATAPDPTCRRFVRLGVKRRRRRQILGATVAFLTASIVIGDVTIPKMTQAARAEVAKAITSYRSLADASLAGHFGGYHALTYALSGTAQKTDNFASRQVMWSALQHNLPVATTRATESSPTTADQLAEPQVVGPSGWSAQVNGPDGVVVVHGPAGSLSIHPTGTVTALAFDDTAAEVAIADSAGIRVWDTRFGTLTSFLEGTPGEVSRLDWHTTNSVVATLANGTTSTWRVSPTRTVASTDAWVMATAASPDGRVAMLSRDGHVREISTNGAGDPTMAAGSGPAASLTWSPAGWVVGRIKDDGTGTLSVINAGHPGPALHLHDCAPNSLAWDERRSRLLATCNGQAHIVSVDLAARQATAIPTTIYAHHVLVDNKSGQVFLASSYNEAVRLVNGKTVSIGPWLSGCAFGTSAAVVARDGSLVTGGQGVTAGCMNVWTPNGSQWERHTFLPALDTQTDTRAIAAAHRSNLVAVGYTDGSILVFDPASQSLHFVAQVSGQEIRGVAFTADDTHILIATRGGQVLDLPTTEASMSLAQLRKVARTRLAIGVRAGLAAG